MRVLSRNLLSMVIDIRAEVRRGRPGIAVLEDEFADLGDEGVGGVAVCGFGEEGAFGEGERGGWEAGEAHCVCVC